MPVPGDEITQLSSLLVTSIAPYIPQLLHLGKEGVKTLGIKAVEEMGKGIGTEGWRLAKDLWSKLSPNVEKSTSALETARELAEKPKDADLQNALCAQIARILRQNNKLVAEMNELLRESGIHRRQSASADHGSIAIVGNVSNSPVISSYRDRDEKSPSESKKEHS